MVTTPPLRFLVAPPPPAITCPSLPITANPVDSSTCVVACRRASDCVHSVCCFNGCGTSCQFETGKSLTLTAPPVAVHAVPEASRPVVVSVDNSITKIQPVDAKIITSSVDEKLMKVPVSYRPQTPVISAVQPQKKHPIIPDLGNPAVAVVSSVGSPPTMGAFQKSGPISAPQKVGACPSVLLNPGCREECLTDVDCAAFSKCCKASCGTKCVEPTITSSCLHRLASFSREWQHVPPPVQCSPDGEFREVQCDFKTRQCWCVGNSGVEVIGTRTTDPEAPPCKSVATPCYSKHLVTDLYGNAFSCRANGCPRGECMTAVGEEVGVCCHMPETTKAPDHFIRRSNCALYRVGIEELQRRGVQGVHQPTCDPDTGLFSRIQCDKSGVCWCVDVETGRELPGTRKENSVGQNVCEGARACPRQCPPTLCPYGLNLDRNGCPQQDCACASPCDAVSCRAGEVCLLRTPSCSSGNCIPIPTCENSPCNVGDRPAIDPRTKRQFSCRESGEICPTGFYCTGFDPDGAGVCCPGREPLLSKTKASSCPHGDPFASSSDGTPMACSAKVNGCPTTHFCLMKPGQKIGVCCVSKPHVCNLSVDRGPCSVSVPRYFYSPMNQTCTKFEYGGCAGNLNNFATNEHCESFCEGVVSDFLTSYNDDAASVETYELGFSLTGPQIPHAARKRAQQTLAEFLSEKFSLSKSSIEDVVIMDDNTARFTIKDAHAGAIAKNISDAVNSGLEFPLNGNYYRAEPHTWFAHQLAERTASNTARVIFWVNGNYFEAASMVIIH
ncbi:Kunitz/Bovine pancreatic trypsin inhibitor domain protein [Ancylostoma caninum]|uniref:Kunitz/Bovine pancreatic trypsin inhibitor domain protein n=1 Tax=Ancylostoma caninum TaxID=29170 RepID=A0A368FTA2_ANCCA|nr:Kunitz/Bovine pancreatic trypsin inhibitor domain protein [Ancylostoma caninum]